MVIHTDFSDFVLFLYIHMALVDDFMHSSEEEIILSKMRKLYDNEEISKIKLSNAIKHYYTLDNEQIIEIIEDSFKHFNQVPFSQRYKVYIDMYDIINADGKIDNNEKVALNALKKVIEIDAETHHE